jgi:hypothetical protein
VAIAGGELTLEMLDLQHNPDTKFYDAPLHVKGLNGMLLIDDFGRQSFNPEQLLNRWIVPMETQVDYLTLANAITQSQHVEMELFQIFAALVKSEGAKNYVAVSAAFHSVVNFNTRLAMTHAAACAVLTGEPFKNLARDWTEILLKGVASAGFIAGGAKAGWGAPILSPQPLLRYISPSVGGV